MGCCRLDGSLQPCNRAYARFSLGPGVTLSSAAVGCSGSVRESAAASMRGLPADPDQQLFLVAAAEVGTEPVQLRP